MTEPTPTANDIPAEFSALLKLEGGEADRHEARAEHLAAVLAGMQRIAYLLAAVDNRQPVGERVKPSRAVRERYSLRCGLSQAGSYALPLDVGIGNLDLLPDEHGLLLDRIGNIFSAVARQDVRALQHLPDAVLSRALREIQKFLPREQDGVRLSLQTRQVPNPPVLSWRASRFIKERLTPATTEDTVMTVTGELMRIDFGTRQVTILYPPTRRELVCTYLPEIEDSIVEARKEPIQVTGKFVLDAEGNPLHLTDVTRIEPLDLSPLVITALEALPVRFKQALELTPILDEDSQQYLCVAEPSLHLDAFALNRENLFDEIQEQLAMLWQEYALADDADLDDEALKLKTTLHSLMEDVSHAEA